MILVCVSVQCYSGEHYQKILKHHKQTKYAEKISKKKKSKHNKQNTYKKSRVHTKKKPKYEKIEKRRHLELNVSAKPYSEQYTNQTQNKTMTTKAC